MFGKTAFLAVVAGSTAAFGAPVLWSTGVGGNGHYYDRIDQTGLTWGQAGNAAAGSVFNGMPGHLAILDTANYAAERDFVFNSVYTPGVTSSRIYWVGAFLPNGSSTWSWTDGTTVPSSIVGGWNIDHAEGAGDEGGGYYQTNSDTIWDYIASNSNGFSSGYIVEYQAVPEPATLTLIGMTTAALLGRRNRSRA